MISGNKGLFYILSLHILFATCASTHFSSLLVHCFSEILCNKVKRRESKNGLKSNFLTLRATS